MTILDRVSCCKSKFYKLEDISEMLENGWHWSFHMLPRAATSVASIYSYPIPQVASSLGIDIIGKYLECMDEVAC